LPELCFCKSGCAYVFGGIASSSLPSSGAIWKMGLIYFLLYYLLFMALLYTIGADFARLFLKNF